MSSRSRRRSLRIQAESTFGTDPTSGDSGASLITVPAEDLGFLDDQKAQHATEWFTGRNTSTITEAGVDGASLKFSTPVRGLTAAAGDGGSPPAADWLSLLLGSVFGAHTDIAGEGVTTGSAAGTLVTDASPVWAIQDLIPVHEAAINGGRTQWRRSASAGTPFTIAPDWTATPSADAIGYGYERYRPSDAACPSFTAYYDLDGTTWVLAGGNVVGVTIKAQAGGRIVADWDVRFDSKTAASRASAPVIDVYTGPTAVLATGAEVFWGTTSYAPSAWELAFGVAAADVSSVGSTNGRSAIETLRTSPVLTLTLPWTVGWETAFRAQTTAMLLLQMGAGILGSSILNTLCFHATKAQVEGAPQSNDASGYLQQVVKLKVVDPGIFVGTTPGIFWQLARA